MAETQEKVVITPVKHINNKTAGVNPKDVVKSGKPLFMIRMFGIIQGVKNFEDRRSGDVKTVFIGDFRAMGPMGETYESDKLFLFKSLEEKLASAFKSSGEKAQELRSIGRKLRCLYGLPEDGQTVISKRQAARLLGT